jgi:hypothetical protein
VTLGGACDVEPLFSPPSSDVTLGGWTVAIVAATDGSRGVGQLAVQRLLWAGALEGIRSVR